MTIDGRLLINIDTLEALDDAVFSGRALFIGAELTADEQRHLRRRLEDMGDEVCAKIVGAFTAQYMLRRD